MAVRGSDGGVDFDDEQGLGEIAAVNGGRSVRRVMTAAVVSPGLVKVRFTSRYISGTDGNTRA